MKQLTLTICGTQSTRIESLFLVYNSPTGGAIPPPKDTNVK
jgi:hypothetical protein